MTVLVTGASGFIGNHLFDRFRGPKVGIERDIGKRPLAGGVVANGDLRDGNFVNRVIGEYQPDVVIHTAALAIVGQALLNTYEAYSSNVLGTLNLLEACKRLSKKPYFMLLTTDKVLGEGDDSTEDKPYPFELLGPYEQSKVMQEILCRRYGGSFPTCIIRSCNVYGPGDRHDRIIPNTIRQCLAGEDPYVFREDPPSHRQYIYVDDLVNAFVMAEEVRLKGIYHVGSPAVLTQQQVVEHVCLAFPDKNLKPVTVDMEARRKQFLWYINQQSLNYERIRRQLGWEPETSFTSGIGKTVEWWRKSPA